MAMPCQRFGARTGVCQSLAESKRLSCLASRSISVWPSIREPRAPLGARSLTRHQTSVASALESALDHLRADPDLGLALGSPWPGRQDEGAEALSAALGGDVGMGLVAIRGGVVVSARGLSGTTSCGTPPKNYSACVSPRSQSACVSATVAQVKV
jgi:hypothetical protein